MPIPRGEMLKGCRVLELAGVLAGPSVGMFLAELGAEVTKVENPNTGGDITRQWKLPSEDPGSKVSAYFCSANWGKKHIFLDLKEAGHLSRVYELAKHSDIVITNFKTGDDIKLGLDYESLKKQKPDIIYASITAYGDKDPRLAYDLVLQAEGGFMHMNGTPESGPLKMPLAMIDMLAAHQLKEGILLALMNKMKTGKGCHVSASLLQSAVSALTNQATNYLMAGHVPGLAGSAHPNIAPYGDTIHTAEGKQVVLAIGTDKQFAKLCSVLQVPELASDSRYAVSRARVSNRESLMEALRIPAAKMNAAELVQKLQEEGVPAGMIKNLAEVFAMDKAKEMILEENADGLLTQRVSSLGFTFSED
jgi:crotonobetainyl-CoA:carnitine CoA-transferase CaiB-like acyl-CoA transferase